MNPGLKQMKASGKEGKFKTVCEKILDLLNIREQYFAKNEEELDEIAKLSCSTHKN